MTVSAGSDLAGRGISLISEQQVFRSIGRFDDWLERNDYTGYDALDLLNAAYLFYVASLKNTKARP